MLLQCATSEGGLLQAFWVCFAFSPSPLILFHLISAVYSSCSPLAD